MEYVTATQLLASLDVTEADTALVDGRAVLRRCLHILQLLQLDDELAPLDESDTLLAQSAQVVGYLAQNVDRQSASAHDNEKEAHVDEEVTRVKQQRHDVEDKLLLEPLLVVAQLEK